MDLKDSLKRILLKIIIFDGIILFVLICLGSLLTLSSKHRLAAQFSSAFRGPLIEGDNRSILVDMSRPVLMDFVGFSWVPQSGAPGFSVPENLSKLSPIIYKALSIKVFFDEDKSIVAGDIKFYYWRWQFMPLVMFSWCILVIISLTAGYHERNRIFREYAMSVESRVNAFRADMAAQVAHDIRSPLAALGAAAKGMTLPEDQRTLIDGAVSRMQGIADDLLARYRTPGVEAKANIETCALGGLIEQVIAEKRLQHKDKAGVKIEFSGGDGLKAAVNQRELQRIISNLVNNAVEAFENGGTVSVNLSKPDGKVLIAVKDDGKGIPAEILAKLCQKGETHGKAGGTGLGLYHARTSVESWGGSLKIDSEPGKGTEVTITLPATAKPAAGLRAVLLDDDALVHMNWKMAAKAAGAELKSYKTPQEFTAAAETLPRDIPVYIDSELGEGAKGEDIAKDLHEKGFTDISMATGHDASKFSGLPWLKVTGKEPPWA